MSKVTPVVLKQARVDSAAKGCVTTLRSDPTLGLPYLTAGGVGNTLFVEVRPAAPEPASVSVALNQQQRERQLELSLWTAAQDQLRQLPLLIRRWAAVSIRPSGLPAQLNIVAVVRGICFELSLDPSVYLPLLISDAPPSTNIKVPGNFALKYLTKFEYRVAYTAAQLRELLPITELMPVTSPEQWSETDRVNACQAVVAARAIRRLYVELAHVMHGAVVGPMRGLLSDGERRESLIMTSPSRLWRWTEISAVGASRAASMFLPVTAESAARGTYQRLLRMCWGVSVWSRHYVSVSPQEGALIWQAAQVLVRQLEAAKQQGVVSEQSETSIRAALQEILTPERCAALDPLPYVRNNQTRWPYLGWSPDAVQALIPAQGDGVLLEEILRG